MPKRGAYLYEGVESMPEWLDYEYKDSLVHSNIDHCVPLVQSATLAGNFYIQTLRIQFIRLPLVLELLQDRVWIFFDKKLHRMRAIGCPY